MRHSIMVMILVGIIFNFTIPIILSDVLESGGMAKCHFEDAKDSPARFRVVTDFWSFVVEFVQGFHFVGNLEYLAMLWLVYDEPVPVYLHCTGGIVMVWRRRVTLFRYTYSIPRVCCWIILLITVALSFAPSPPIEITVNVKLISNHPITSFICFGYLYSTHAVIMMMLILSGDVETNPGPVSNPFIDDKAAASDTSEDDYNGDDASKLDDLFIDDTVMDIDFTPYFDLDEISYSSGTSFSGDDSGKEDKQESDRKRKNRDKMRRCRVPIKHGIGVS